MGYFDFCCVVGVSLFYCWMYLQDEYNNNVIYVEVVLNEQFGGSDKILDKFWWLQ